MPPHVAGSGGRVTIRRDRGSELNSLRLRGVGVDVTFSVAGERFPVHRFVVSLFSPVLRALSDPASGFREARHTSGDSGGGKEIELRDVDPTRFGELLTYFYTGTCTVHDENVFEFMEMAGYLQIEGDDLAERCAEFLESGLATCSLNFLFRVWNAAEASGCARLRSKVLSVLDFRLEGFLAKDIFMFLGFEEIKQVLCRDALCIRSEKILFDSLAEWIRKKVLKDENDGDDHEEETALQVAAELLCLVKLDALPTQHLRKSLPCLRLPLRQSSKSSRKCEKCLYFFEYSRDESEILGIKEFASDRRNALTFATFDPSTASVSVLRSPTQSKSYFQHYGPHSTTGFSIVFPGDCLHQMLAVGGMRKTSRGEDGVLADDMRIFDLTTATWDHSGGVLPKGLVEFGTVVHRDMLYIIGGLSDEVCEGGRRKRSFTNKELFISKGIYRISCNNLTTMRGWESLESMPTERTDFAAAVTDDDRIYVVGRDFCDAFDIASGRWRALSVPGSGSCGSVDLGAKRPVVVTTGDDLYVFGNRPIDGSNVFLRLDTISGSWTTLRSLNLRQDVISAFAHNNLVFLIGWQRETKTAVHRFDPITGEWIRVAEKLSGTFRPGILLRRQHLNEGFFDGSHSLNTIG